MAEPKQVKVIKGGLNIAKRLLDDGEGAGLTASQRAEAGRKAAELIKSQPQVKASEALGQLMEKGFKKTTTTQADRTRVGGGNIGGAPFPAISEADPAYKGKVWGVMDEGTAARLKNLTDDETAWTTMLGSANQLKTNPIVFDKLKRGFVDSMKQGNLSDELASKINHNLALTFGEGADIRDPKIWRQADTFEKRAALADVMMGQGTAPSKGGIAIGGEKSGKGVIFKPTDILKRETEPSLLHTEHGGDVPTFAAGPRLFRLNKESVYDPSLHPGFPTLLTGEDLKINMKPTPTEVYLRDWHQKFKKDNPERKGPGYYDLALGVKGEGLPSQELNDEYIRHLLREGFKDGGSVDIDAADARLSSAIEKRMAKGGAVDIEAADARLADAINARMADGGKVVKGLGKIAKKLMADEVPVTEAAKGKTQALLKNNLGPAFGAYGYTDDILRRERGSFAGNFGLDYGQKLAPSFEFVPIKNLKVTEKVVDAKVRSLMDAIKESGNTLDNQIPPVIVDSNGNVLDGHHRIEAARRLGYEQVPVIEKFDIQNGPQLGDEYADGGKVVKGAGKVFKKLFADAPTESKIIQPPNIIIPSKLSNVKEAVRQSKGEYGARRVERAADEIPNLERLYKEEALKQAFDGDNAKALMTMNPADFEKYAMGLPTRTVTEPRSFGDKTRMSTEDYLKYLRTLPEGFDDVPFLEINKQEQGLPLMPFISGHEGRHRNRAMAESGEKSGLVRLFPRTELREGFPRKSQEEYIEALKKELEMTGNRVSPESNRYNTTEVQRPPIDLPDIYAGGGLAMAGGGIPHMADAGRVFKGMGKLGKKLFADPAESSVTSARRGDRMADQMGGLNIIKDPGGNWLSGSVEKNVQPLLEKGVVNHRVIPYGPDFDVAIRQRIEDLKKSASQPGYQGGAGRAVEHLEEDLQNPRTNEIAVNNWVNRNLTNYVKKEMGTLQDPVRRLAEEGIIHIPTDQVGLNRYKAPESRRMYGGVQEGRSEAAQAWEDASDVAIYPGTIGEIKRVKESGGPGAHRYEPWMEKVDPNTQISRTTSNFNAHDLGFSHIIDVLKEDLAAGRIRPEQLNKVSMEQAVRRTYEYDQELAAKINAARAAKREGLPVKKEYPEGFKWVELNKPGSFASESEAMGHSVRGYEPPKGHPDWTEGSGDSGSSGYGHGGWDAIKSGKAKVYSLIDAKGEPHVTVEVGKNGLREQFFKLPQEEKEKINSTYKGWESKLGREPTPEEHDSQLYKIMSDMGYSPTEKITQIKGKSNAAPKEDYLPFVQDFVKSGKWSDVGDLSNTGMFNVQGKYFTEPELTEAAKKYGRMGVQDTPWEVARQRHIDAGVPEDEALRNWVEAFKEGRGRLDIPPPTEGMAEGGGVFKKIQFMDKGGITTSAGTFSPEELGVNASDIGMSDKRWNKIKSNASELYGEGKEQLEKEYRQLGYKGGKKDFAIRVGSQLLGGGSDLVNLGLMGLDFVQSAIPAISKPESVLDTAGTGDRIPKFKLASDEPWLGSEHFIRKFKEAELLGNKEFPLTEIAAGFVAPAAAANALRKSKQAYKGAKALMDTPKKRRGGLTAMTR